MISTILSDFVGVFGSFQAFYVIQEGEAGEMAIPGVEGRRSTCFCVLFTKQFTVGVLS